MDKKFISTKESAELLNISIRTAQLWASKGILPAWRTAGGHCKVLRSGVDKILSERQSLSDNFKKDLKRENIEQDNYLKILVIEDDILFHEFYKIWVEECDTPIKLFTASNGYEGLIQAGNKKPDLIITDLLMPGMNGLQMLQELDENKALTDTRVVVVTSLLESEILEMGNLPQNIRLLQKPVSLEALEQELVACKKESVTT